MKKTDTVSVNKTSQTGQENAQQDVKLSKGSQKSVALAAVQSFQHGSLPAMPDSQREQAAGIIGNQNVLKLMETSAGVQKALSEASMEVDTQMLADVLSGPPDGPVCPMETLVLT